MTTNHKKFPSLRPACISARVDILAGIRYYFQHSSDNEITFKHKWTETHHLAKQTKQTKQKALRLARCTKITFTSINFPRYVPDSPGIFPRYFKFFPFRNARGSLPTVNCQVKVKSTINCQHRTARVNCEVNISDLTCWYKGKT